MKGINLESDKKRNDMKRQERKQWDIKVGTVDM
jgi:hypothetical protein